MERLYEGVKFEVSLLEKMPVFDSKVEELKKWSRIFSEKDLAPSSEEGSFGNLSYRIEGSTQFVITATQADLGCELFNEDFVKVSDCDLINNVVYATGIKAPSSESMLHHAIYRQRPDVMAVLHGHCSAIVDKAEDLAIPTTKKDAPFGSLTLVNRVLEILGKHNFLIVKNHGFFAMGKTIEEAGERALEILGKC